MFPSVVVHSSHSVEIMLEGLLTGGLFVASYDSSMKRNVWVRVLGIWASQGRSMRVTILCLYFILYVGIYGMEDYVCVYYAYA